MNGVQTYRKKIAEYVKQMQIMDVYLYDTPFEMNEKLGFTLTTPNLNGYDYSIDSSIIIIDVLDKKQLCICVIDSPSEELMLEELKNNKINFFFNISKAQQNSGDKKEEIMGAD